MKKYLFCALLLLGAAALPATAQTSANLDPGVAPPPPRYEAVPAPLAGYVWAKGYWRWEDYHHVWIPGRWIEARQGSYWVADRWHEKSGHHYFQPGHWEQRISVGKQDPAGKVKDRGKGWLKDDKQEASR